jgi:hypothetical protein
LKNEKIFTPFKYYTKLLSDIVFLEQNFGVIVTEYLNEIRKSLIKDLNFEKKKRHEISNAYLQMFFMSMIVFSFILSISIIFFLLISRFLFNLFFSYLFLSFILHIPILLLFLV